MQFARVVQNSCVYVYARVLPGCMHCLHGWSVSGACRGCPLCTAASLGPSPALGSCWGLLAWRGFLADRPSIASLRAEGWEPLRSRLRSLAPGLPWSCAGRGRKGQVGRGGALEGGRSLRGCPPAARPAHRAVLRPGSTMLRSLRWKGGTSRFCFFWCGSARWDLSGSRAGQ